MDPSASLTVLDLALMLVWNCLCTTPEKQRYPLYGKVFPSQDVLEALCAAYSLAHQENGIVGDELLSRWPYNFRDRELVTYACPDGAPHKILVDGVWYYTAFKCT